MTDELKKRYDELEAMIEQGVARVWANLLDEENLDEYNLQTLHAEALQHIQTYDLLEPEEDYDSYGDKARKLIVAEHERQRQQIQKRWS